MKKQPKKKLSINKESLRRLTSAELEVVRAGAAPDVPENPELDPDVGTFRECVL